MPGTFHFTVDGLDHAIKLDNPPTPEDAEALTHAAREKDDYTVAESKYGLPKGSLRAIASTESSFNPKAKSHTGARGLMQFTHRTGKAYGITDSNWHDPKAQIDAAGRFMADNMKRSKGDLRGALRLYGDPNQANYPDLVLSKMPKSEGPQQHPTPVASVASPAPGASELTGTKMSTPTTPPKLSLAGEAIYRGVTRPLAQLSSVLTQAKIGPMTTPAEFKRAAIVLGLPGAERLDVQAPQGVIDTLTNASGIFEATVPALYGTGVVAARLTGNEETADTIEGVLGLGMLARGGLQTLRSIRQPVGLEEQAGVFRRLFARKYSPNELRALEAEKAARDAEYFITDAQKGVTEAQAGVAAARPAVAGAQITAAGTAAEGQKELTETELVARRAEETAAIRRESARKFHADAVRQVDEAERSTPTTSQQLREQFGIPETTTPMSVGMELRTPRTSGEVTTGFAGMTQRLARQRREAYAETNALADDLGVSLPGGHAIEITMQDAALDYHQQVTRSPGATRQEKELADQLLHLNKVALRDPRTGEVIAWVDRAYAKQIPELANVPENLSYRELNDLHSRMSQVAIKPNEYPLLQSKDGRRAFYRLKNTVENALRTLETASPELMARAERARGIVRDVEKPFLSQTVRRVISPTKTPTQVFDTFLGKDPTHIMHTMLHATAEEREAIGLASLNKIITQNEMHGGRVVWTKVLDDFDKLPRETQRLIAATGGGNATRVLDELRGTQTRIAEARDVAERAAARLKNADKALEEERDVSRKVFTKMTRRQETAMDEAVKDVRDALAAVAEREQGVTKAEKGVKLSERTAAQAKRAYARALRRPVGGEDTVMRMGGGKAFGIMHIVRSAIDVTSGYLPFAVVQGYLGYLFLRRPKLVKAALETPAHLPEGRKIAAALHATLQGWRGYEQNHPRREAPPPAQAANQ